MYFQSHGKVLIPTKKMKNTKHQRVHQSMDEKAKKKKRIKIRNKCEIKLKLKILTGF